MSKNIYYTYAWLREDRTPYYIGKGKNKRAWRTGSPPKERVLILKKNLSENEALKHEVYMISIFGRKDLGTGILHNFTDGGEGSSGYQHKPESKQKMAKSHAGKTLSAETRRKMSEAGRGERNSMYGRTGESNPMFGKGHTDEVKQKISKTKTGKPLSDRHRKRISEGLRLAAQRRNEAKRNAAGN